VGRLERVTADPATVPAAPVVDAPSLRGMVMATRRWDESLALVDRHLLFTRRTVHAGDAVQVVGALFTYLHIINAGVFKTSNLTDDGREQVIGVHFKGDWIGLDGIASGRCPCGVVSTDTGEVWSVRYTTLLACSATVPALTIALHAAMSGQLARERAWRMAQATLPADARVADFVRCWAESLAERGQRTDQVVLRMTRAEIGTYLCMTLETTSRAFTRLERVGLIRFDEKGRRKMAIPSVEALAEFVRCSLSPNDPPTLQ
jgi:CRP/FNR family transcriptional regulator